MPFVFKKASPCLVSFAMFISAGAQTNITKVEYYLDKDPGYGIATPVSVTASANVSASFNIATSGLLKGMHIVGIRSRDAKGIWSMDEQWLLFKPAIPPVTANITKTEWYIDRDPGYGIATPVTSFAPGTTIPNISFPVTLNTITNGMHVIGVRSCSATGAWSLDEQWLLFKSTPPVVATNIKRIEYYIDNDPGYGKGLPLAFNAATNINPLLSFINAAGLDSGAHKFMVRSQDINGAWSFDDSLVFIINSARAAPYININSVAFTNACTAGPFTIGYHATGTFNTGNQFIAELSNAIGDFSNATPLATPVNSLSKGGLINCIMPPNIQKGTGYRMRVRSTNPALISNQNTLSISVDKTFLGKDTAFLLLCAESGFDLTRVYNTANSNVLWSVSNPTSAPVGVHTLFATNAIGCKDTSVITLTQKLADWTGNISSDWHNPLNWSPQNVPDSGTTVLVGFNAVPARPCVISSRDAEVFQIRIKDGLNAYYVQVNSNRKIIIRGNCKIP